MHQVVEEVVKDVDSRLVSMGVAELTQGERVETKRKCEELLSVAHNQDYCVSVCVAEILDSRDREYDDEVHSGRFPNRS